RLKKRGGLRKGRGEGGEGRGKREIRKPQNKKNIEPTQLISPPWQPDISSSLFALPRSLLPSSPFTTIFFCSHHSPPTASSLFPLPLSLPSSSLFTAATSLLFDSFLVESSDVRN
ncbi:unnamed protein product, partial [Musa acuminata subsp. burmannicoides]